MSPALTGRFFTTEPPRKPNNTLLSFLKTILILIYMHVCHCICLPIPHFFPELPFPFWIIVLVLSDCCNKIQETGWLTNNRNVFIIVLEAGKSNMKALPDLVSNVDLPPRWPSLCCNLTCQKGQGDVLGFFYNGVSLSCGLCLHELIVF